MSIDLPHTDCAHHTWLRNRWGAVTPLVNTKFLVAALSTRSAVDRGGRQDKVAEIKQRIVDGSYHIDATVLARNLLRAGIGLLPPE
jgi:hypothetical protein